MNPPPPDIPVDHFSEYAMCVESADYPKTDFTQLQFRGRVDTAALAAAHREALALVPLYSCHLVERREGLRYKPWWVYDQEVENTLRIEDCRALADDPFDPMAFSTRHYALRTRRCFDLRREFPFNCSLLRATDDEWIFSILYHHSAMDARKAYRYLTALLTLYHERVTGQPPQWSDALGMAALKRRGGTVDALSFGRFAQEQLGDVWWHNRGDRVSNVAGAERQDYRTVKGRHSVRAVIDEPRTFDGIMALPRAHEATLNDLLFTVARRVLGGWNAEHQVAYDRFRFMLITSLWGRKQLPETAGAGVSALTFVTHDPGRDDFAAELLKHRDIRRDLLRRGLDIGLHDFMCKLVGSLRVFPMATRSKLIHQVANSVPCTFYLSNVGVVWPRFQDGRPTLDSQILGAGDFEISDIHSSASISRRLGLGLTTRIHNRRLYLNFVADRFRFGHHEVQTLVDRFVAELSQRGRDAHRG